MIRNDLSDWKKMDGVGFYKEIGDDIATLSASISEPGMWHLEFKEKKLMSRRPLDEVLVMVMSLEREAEEMKTPERY